MSTLPPPKPLSDDEEIIPVHDNDYFSPEDLIPILDQWGSGLFAEALNEGFDIANLPVNVEMYPPFKPNKHIVHFVFGVNDGDILMVGVGELSIGETYHPLIYVTERRKRTHRPGTGPRQKYKVTKSNGWIPNYSGILAHVKERQGYINQLNVEEKRIKEIADIRDKAIATDLGETVPPKGMMISFRDRGGDGSGDYVVYLGSVIVSRDKLKNLCQLLA